MSRPKDFRKMLTNKQMWRKQRQMFQGMNLRRSFSDDAIMNAMAMSADSCTESVRHFFCQISIHKFICHHFDTLGRSFVPKFVFLVGLDLRRGLQPRIQHKVLATSRRTKSSAIYVEENQEEVEVRQLGASDAYPVHSRVQKRRAAPVSLVQSE